MTWLRVLQADRAPNQLLTVWASHKDLGRILVPDAQHNGHGACYRVKDTECQASQQTPAALVDSILTWQQRRLWAQVSFTVLCTICSCTRAASCSAA